MPWDSGLHTFLSLAEAREKAQSTQKELLEGINPLEKKRERKRVQVLFKSQMMTFSEGASLNTSTPAATILRANRHPSCTKPTGCRFIEYPSRAERTPQTTAS